MALYHQNVQFQLLQERKQKLAEYETFINERLKVDLAKILEQRDKVFKQISDYAALQKSIDALQLSESKKLKTLINLGSEFYVQAKVADASRIFVDVGLGFHVEYTLDEALHFIQMKQAHLASRAEALGQQANSIKSRIQLMYQGMSELMSLPGGDERKQ